MAIPTAPHTLTCSPIWRRSSMSSKTDGERRLIGAGLFTNAPGDSHAALASLSSRRVGTSASLNPSSSSLMPRARDLRGGAVLAIEAQILRDRLLVVEIARRIKQGRPHPRPSFAPTPSPFRRSWPAPLANGLGLFAVARLIVETGVILNLPPRPSPRSPLRLAQLRMRSRATRPGRTRRPARAETRGSVRARRRRATARNR